MNFIPLLPCDIKQENVTLRSFLNSNSFAPHAKDICTWF